MSTDNKQSIHITKKSISLNLGCEYQLSDHVYLNGTSQTATYTSMDNTIASVGEDGRVCAYNYGKTDIKVASISQPSKYTYVSVCVSDCGCDCDDCSDTIGVNSILFTTEPSNPIFVGDTGYITTYVYPTNATDKAITYSTSNPNVLSCTAYGRYEAIAEGTATITATANNGVFASKTYEVEVSPTSITVNKDHICLNPGCNFLLVPTVLPTTASQCFTIYSNDTTVADVDINGTIFANNYGTTTIVVKSGIDSSVTTYVTVSVSDDECDCKEHEIEVDSISLNSSTSTSIMVGDSGSITATVSPSNATNSTVAYSSDNAAVLDCSLDGTYIAKEAGIAVVTAAAANGVVKALKFNITDLPSSISVVKSEICLTPNATYTLKPMISPNTASQTVIYKSNDDSIVKVDESGRIRAIGYGVTKVKISSVVDSKVFINVSVCVSDCGCDDEVDEVPVVNVLLKSSTSNIITTGVSGSLTSTVLPSNASNKQVAFYSNKPSVLDCTSKGDYTARMAGEATVTAIAANNVKGSIRFTVYSTPVRISVPKYSIYLKPYEIYALNPVVEPSTASQEVTYHSSNPNVAYVRDDGVICAYNNGSAIVKITSKTTPVVSTYVTVSVCNADDISDTPDTREKVRIKKDSDSFFVEFSNGLVWKNVGYDVSPLNRKAPQSAKDRANENLVKTFTEKQIAFLYLFDPLGVEHYVKYYYSTHEIDTVELLYFKDRVYEEIFGERPHLFGVFPSGTVQPYNYPSQMTDSFRYSVYSDAEVLFGAHAMINLRSVKIAFAKVLIDLFKDVTHLSDIELGVEVYQAMFYAGAVNGMVSSSTSKLVDDYAKNSLTKGGYRMFTWATIALDFLNELGEAFAPPNSMDVLIYKKVDSENFQTNFVIDGENISMEEVINRFNNNMN